MPVNKGFSQTLQNANRKRTTGEGEEFMALEEGKPSCSASSSRKQECWNGEVSMVVRKNGAGVSP